MTTLFVSTEGFDQACLSKIEKRDWRQVINLSWITYVIRTQKNKKLCTQTEIIIMIFLKKVGWLVILRIKVDLAIFQPYLDLEAGDNQSLKIQVARPGIEPWSSCSASQELNHSTTAAPLKKDLKWDMKEVCSYMCMSLLVLDKRIKKMRTSIDFGVQFEVKVMVT